MKKNAYLLTALSLFLMMLVRVAAAQEITKEMVSGTWVASIHDGDKTTTEQWTIKQDGDKISGTVKDDKGEHPLTGTIEGAVLRATITNSSSKDEIHIYVNGDTGDGSKQVGGAQVGGKVLLVNIERKK